MIFPNRTLLLHIFLARLILISRKSWSGTVIPVRLIEGIDKRVVEVVVDDSAVAKGQSPEAWRVVMVMVVIVIKIRSFKRQVLL